jgi:hypothetical protein
MLFNLTFFHFFVMQIWRAWCADNKREPMDYSFSYKQGLVLVKLNGHIFCFVGDIRLVPLYLFKFVHTCRK